MMDEFKKRRNFSQPITWTGDLNDDCTAKWAGLMLRAEWMNEEDWWWCVYDMLDGERQIDSSNEHEVKPSDGKQARSKAEAVARTYIKDQLISEMRKSATGYDVDDLIADLKVMGILPFPSIWILINDLDYKYMDAKDKVFDSPVWEGEREQSEEFTQLFLDVASQDADKVEFDENGRVISVFMDLTKDGPKEKVSFWNRVKRIFGK